MVVVKHSALVKAMYYMDMQWPNLMIHTQDGRLNIDNNAAGNSIQPFVIGRKNHMFSDTVSAAKARANGFEPNAYLKHVFT